MTLVRSLLGWTIAEQVLVVSPLKVLLLLSRRRTAIALHVVKHDISFEAAIEEQLEKHAMRHGWHCCK